MFLLYQEVSKGLGYNIQAARGSSRPHTGENFKQKPQLDAEASPDENRKNKFCLSNALSGRLTN